ncbi:endonuclease/exonuclease/phosphatase family protein [Cellulomonas cellasea]|nr:endonuclease/exonuclease/phosphatase family protein [Cellulomonas cellasea]
MTWNVWWRFGGPAWRARQDAIAAVVEAVRPDVLGLQEAWLADGRSQADEIAARLGQHAAFVPISVPPVPEPAEHPEQVGVEMGVGLVSRWPVRAVTRHVLPAQHREPPAALVATLDHPAGPLHVVVACTEWEVDRADDHLAQTRALAALLTDPGLDGDLPVVFLGDLNAGPGTPELAPLDAVATDLWSAGGGDPDAVTLSSAVPFAPLEAVKQIDRRIDHAYARPGRPGASVVAHGSVLAGTAEVDGVLPSDHWAVVTDLDV